VVLEAVVEQQQAKPVVLLQAVKDTQAVLLLMALVDPQPLHRIMLAAAVVVLAQLVLTQQHHKQAQVELVFQLTHLGALQLA